MEKNFKLRGGQTLPVGGKTLVMGIINVTPDSFSDGGKFFSPEKTYAHAKKLAADGADILDIGAESTRPEAVALSADEEFARLKKVLPALRDIGVPISIDTYKPEVAERALEMGAEIINDVHGLEDARMIEVAKKYDVPVVVVHSEKVSDCDIVEEVKTFFRQTAANCAARGFDTEKIIFDPGIGFGKTHEECLTILRRLDELKTLDGKEISLLIGVSRKSFIGWATGLELGERDAATGALCVCAINNGVNIVRVHNVEMISRMCQMTDKLRGDF